MSVNTVNKFSNSNFMYMEKFEKGKITLNTITLMNQNSALKLFYFNYPEGWEVRSRSHSTVEFGPKPC